MIKVLIVDDERNIREGITKLIDWESLGCEVVGAVANGVSALDFIKTNEVDLVVTDIKMPAMDGLELSKHICEDFPHIKVIILTAYSEFDMAKKAISFRVSDFIIKNEFMDELPKAVLEVSEKILKEKESRPKSIDTKAESDDRYFLNIIKSLISNSSLSEEDIKGFENINLCICACEINRYKDDENNERNLYEMFENILKIGLKNLRYTTIKVNPELLIIGVSYEKSSGFNLNRVVENFSNILIMVEEFMRIEVKIGISTEISDIKDLKDGYRQAKDALSKIDKKGCFLKVYEGDLKQKNGEFIDVDGYSEKICELTFDEKNNGAENALEDFSDKLKASGCSFEQCKLYMLVIYSTIIHRAVRYQLNVELDFNDYEEKIYKEVQSANTISALKEVGENLIANIRDICIGKKNFKNELVKKVDDCIKENYKSELTLQTISNEIFLNSSYVSRAYKKMTGFTVTEAINMYRVNTAKDLLKTSNLKIYEVAESVGFKDPAYFTNVFVKYTGHNPSDYRQNS
ncbi:MAG: response regulator [Lachnospiraceae bacterium]|nr:response regulator [Lachnospiraceae bacterium]